jgi:serine/threonine protein kinase
MPSGPSLHPPIVPTDPSLAGLIVGGCRLVELLGVGGMGAVWKAQHLALDVPVAIKLMLPIQELDPNAGERLLREARAAARLRHPNIVGVLNVGEDAGLPFLVMELVEGQSLQTLLDQRGALPVGEAVGFALQILSALDLTFEHGIVHRDVKPDNILIDKRGVAKLADLGLAKQAGTELSLTRTGAVMGSPYYIAPEQAANSKTADPRADIYSLGCVLFHMLAGTPPFTGVTHIEVILKHIGGPIPDLSLVDRGVPKGLSAVVATMMAKSPADRYTTPTDVRRALDPFAAHALPAAISPNADRGQAGTDAKIDAKIAKTRVRRVFWTLGAALLLLGAALAVVARGRNAPKISASQSALPLRVSQASTSPERIVIDEAAHAQSSAASDKSREPTKPARRTPAPRRLRYQAAATNPPGNAPQEVPSVSGAGSLSDALASHDTNRLRQLLDRGTPPNVGDGVTSPLHQAVHMGQPHYLRMLLEKGANPNTRDQFGEMPLHYALRRGDRATVGMLLDFGANPNARDRTGRSPLEIADGDDDLIAKLREKGANR